MKDGKSIDDQKAAQMLKTIFENIGDDELIEQYMNALEINYRKAEGTISDYIFYNDYSIDEIMDRLKKDDVTYL